MKRILSLLLVVVLISSLVVTASAYSVFDEEAISVAEAIKEHELLYEESVDTFRYYFLMPDGMNGDLGDNEASDYYGQYAPSWCNKFSSEPAIYWWDSNIADPPAWTGYSVEIADSPSVFYADVPQAVTTIIWNNGVDGGMDSTLDIYYCAAQSLNIPSEYYDAGESENYPDGTDSFDNMIYVIDPDLISINEISLKMACGGEWYYYYGNGCYGFEEDGTEADCLRDDHYDDDGNHHTTEPVTCEECSSNMILKDIEYSTCESEGYYTYECSSCDHIMYSYFGEKAPHKIETLEAVDVTCTTDGLTEGEWCTVCGEVFVAQETIPAIGHKPVISPAVDPSCESAGKTASSHCENCGEVYVKAEILPQLEHNFVSDNNAVEPDCENDGHAASSSCTLCGKVIEPEIYPALGHNYYMLSGKPATETEDGLTDGVACSTCGYVLVEQEIIPATGNKGDVDSDGCVTIMDATHIQLYLAYYVEFNDSQFRAADIDNSGDVSIIDACSIMRFLAGITSQL